VRSRLLHRVVEKFVTAHVWLTSRVMAAVWLQACDTVGANTRTFWRPHIDNRGRIVIGSGVRLNSHWAPVELATGPDGEIAIADGVYVNYGTLISAHSRVRIGADVMIGNYCIIADTSVPGIGMPREAPQEAARAVEIGEGAWLAARVTVLPGARIGARAVIAAGSVVAGEIPANAVAGGIPARVLRVAPPAADVPVMPEPVAAAGVRR
jgi:acetyltransferase-like isoleucine patch superfamily enzyme